MQRLPTVAITVLLLLMGCGKEETPSVTSEEAAPAAEGGPQVSVTADKTHAVQPGDEITLTVAVTDFTLDAAKIGASNEPGVGHYHVYLDDASGDDYLGVSGDASVKINVPDDITDGSHDIRVVLHNNDHSPVDPPASGSVLLIVYRL